MQQDKNKKINSTSRGFTLIETLVAMLIFTSIAVFGISVLVNMTRNYRVTGEVRQALDTVNYVMEDMSRNIRLGTMFVVPVCSPQTFQGFNSPNDCPPASGGAQGSLSLGFQAYDSIAGVNDHEIVYLIENARLYKASTQSSNITFVDASSPFFIPVTPSNIFIDGAKSGFSVSNNNPSSVVPIVSIRLAGSITYQDKTIPFDLQTTIAPRNRQ